LASDADRFLNRDTGRDDLSPAKLYFAGDLNTLDVESTSVLKLKFCFERIWAHVIWYSLYFDTWPKG
jgi:hypothetical protein